MPVSTHISGDGTVYLRTQQGNTSEEIAESLVPYIGRTMRAYLPNYYGYHHWHSVTLLGVSGAVVMVEVLVNGTKHVAEVNAFSGFGSYCTVIDPVRGE